MQDASERIISGINEIAKEFRNAHAATFDKYHLYTLASWDDGPVIGIRKREPRLQDTDRSTIVQVNCMPSLDMFEMTILGPHPPLAEFNLLKDVLTALLRDLGKARLIRYSDATFFAIASRATDRVRDEHWRGSALPVAIHHGDIVVLKSPVANALTGQRVQVVLAYRADPSMPLGAADITTGKVIPGFILKPGRAAKLTEQSAQHIDPKLMSRNDIRLVLQHQIAKDAQKAERLGRAKR